MIRTLPELLAGPDRTALVQPGGESLEAARVANQAHALRRRFEPRPGERIGILLPNVPLLPATLHAVTGAGGSAVLLNPLSAAREVREACADAGVERIATLRTMADRCGDLEVLAVDGTPLEEAAAGTAHGAGTASIDPGSEAVVVYTSAMSGRARGARLSHRNLVANARSTVEAMGLGPNDLVVAALPWIHLFGLTVTLNAPLLAGAAVLPIARFHPRRTLEAAVRSGATVLVGVPSMYAALCDVADAGPVPDHRLRLAICGGAALPHETARRFEERFGIPLRQGYGLTEAGPVCLFNRVDQPNHLGTLGRPFPGVDASIRSASGTELAAGEVGELWVRGENVFMGYVGEADHIPATVHGGWLRTGDLASRDEAGIFRFRGVLKSMFTRSGFNVYPREIERAVQEDTRVRSAAAYAAPDPKREHEIVLDVVALPGVRLGAADVREICADRLAAYKQPGRVRVLDSEGNRHPIDTDR